MSLSDSGFYLDVRQEKADFLSGNFASMSGLNLLPFASRTYIRKKLGDFVHINFFQMSLISTMYAQPAIIEDIMRICRLVGYYMVRSPAKKFRVASILEKLSSGEGESWKVPANKVVENVLKQAWKRAKIGEVLDINADSSEKMITFRMKDIGCSIKAIGDQDCSLAATLCGVAEALTGGIWSGQLTSCQHLGEPYCEVRIYPRDEDFTRSDVGRVEYEQIVDRLAENIVNQKLEYPRDKLGECFHFSVPQTTNYLLTSPTLGHSVLRKHAGVIVGGKIAEYADLEGEEQAFHSLQDNFKYLGVGLLSKPKKQGENLSLRMDESVYSSGVKNINTKLDVYPAGILEGMLNQTTSEKWQVDETKCIANGNDYCEFICRKR